MDKIENEKKEVNARRCILKVSGNASISMRPDYAIFKVATTHRAAEAEKALSDANGNAESTITLLEGLGLEFDDIKTESLSVRECHHWSNNECIHDGFEANCILLVRVNNLESFGLVISSLSKIKSLDIFDIEFGLNDSKSAESEVRRLSVLDAFNKARDYANGAGLEVKCLRMILECESSSSDVPIYGARGGEEEITFRPKNVEIASSITAEYELG